jgi:hypothetical protein
MFPCGFRLQLLFLCGFRLQPDGPTRLMP